MTLKQLPVQLQNIDTSSNDDNVVLTLTCSQKHLSLVADGDMFLPGVVVLVWPIPVTPPKLPAPLPL